MSFLLHRAFEEVHSPSVLVCCTDAASEGEGNPDAEASEGKCGVEHPGEPSEVGGPKQARGEDSISEKHDSDDAGVIDTQQSLEEGEAGECQQEVSSQATATEGNCSMECMEHEQDDHITFTGQLTSPARMPRPKDLDFNVRVCGAPSYMVHVSHHVEWPPEWPCSSESNPFDKQEWKTYLSNMEKNLNEVSILPVYDSSLVYDECVSTQCLYVSAGNTTFIQKHCEV